MDALAKRFEPRTMNNKVHLMTQLFNMKICEGANILEHVNVIYWILNQLTSLSINFDDEIYAHCLIAGKSSVPPLITQQGRTSLLLMTSETSYL